MYSKENLLIAFLHLAAFLGKRFLFANAVSFC